MRDRYGLTFHDDGASFRVRRNACLYARPQKPSGAVRLIRAVLLFIAPFAALFVIAVFAAVGAGIMGL